MDFHGHRSDGSRLAINLFLSLLVLSGSNALGNPVIGSVTGAIEHGNSITIQGNSFGSDPNAVPRIWDDATGNSVLDLWDARYPSDNTSQYITEYRTPGQVNNAAGRGVPLPHPHVTRYIAGAHYHPTTNGGLQNRNVGLTTANIGNAATTYMSFYYRADPNWWNSGGDNNHKMYSYSADDSIYPSNDYWYFDALQSFGNSNTWQISHNYFAGNPRFLDTCSDVRSVDGSLINWYHTKPGGNRTKTSTCNMFPKTSNKSPKRDWIKLEFILKHNDPDDGLHQIYQDNRKIWHVELDDDDREARSSTLRSESIGGYSRDHGIGNSNAKDNWRYFSDVYYSSTWSRVMLANQSAYANASIVEPQIPVRWSDREIEVTVNLGRLDASQPLYLFVFDKSGRPNSVGYELEDVVRPNPPTELRVEE